MRGALSRLAYASRSPTQERWYRPRAAALRVLASVQYGLAALLAVALGALTLTGWRPQLVEALYFGCMVLGLAGLGLWSQRTARRRFPILVLDDARQQLRWEGAEPGQGPLAYGAIKRVVVYPNLPLVDGQVDFDATSTGWVVGVVDQEREATVAAVFGKQERQLGMDLAHRVAERCGCVLDIRVAPRTVMTAWGGLDDEPSGRPNA
jgi:hypothetical protein